MKGLFTKIVSLIITICIVCSVLTCNLMMVGATSEIWDGTSAGSYVGGTGTANDPYLIGNAAQLKRFADEMNSKDPPGGKYENLHVKLIADIYLNDISDYSDWETNAPDNEWTPIGSYSAWNNCVVFSGSFDGNGHTIYGMYVNSNSNYAGFFTAAGFGDREVVIKNLNFENVLIKGQHYSGGIVGYSLENLTIENCSFSGKVSGGTSWGNIGGLVGQYAGKADKKLAIKNSYTEGTVEGTWAIGGLLGFANAANTTVEIKNSYSVCDVACSSSGGAVGGLIGRFNNSNNAGNTISIVRSFFSGRLRPDNTGGTKSTGTLIGGLGTATTVFEDAYYNYSSVTRSWNESTQGVSKTAAEFSNGTVTNLLNTAAIEAGESQAWFVQETDKIVFTNVFYKTHSLVLTGEIGVNFFMDLSNLTDEEKEECYMTFSVNNSDKEFDAEFDAGFTDKNGKGYHGFTCFVSSVQMAEIITPTFHYGDGKTLLGKPYSVKDYIDYVAANSDGFDSKVVTLVKALGDYGHYAQIYLGSLRELTYTGIEKYRTSDYTDYSAYTTALDSDGVTKTIEDTAVTGLSYNLNFDSNTYVNVQLTTAEPLIASATVDGKTLYLSSSGKLRTQGLLILQLGTPIVITGRGTSNTNNFTITLSGLSYIRAILNSGSTSAAAKNAVSALYDYYQSACTYAGV